MRQNDPTDEHICLGYDEDVEAYHGSVMPPIVQTSLFIQPSFKALMDGLGGQEHRNYLYTRGQNPTVAALETKLAKLERGDACKCFASGMAAISAVMMGLLQSGDHVLYVNHIYGPALQLASHLQRFGISYDVTIESDAETVSRHIKPNTKMIYMENPGTMLFRMLDIRAIAEMARERQILTVLDNSWATPLFQKPLTMGVDVVVHSCTKYVGGHSDVVAGAVVTNPSLLEQIFYNAFLLHGGILAPFDAWLLIRGLRTMPVRMQQHQADALEVARFLQDHPAVRRVFHPALRPEERELAEKQLSGYSGLFSIELQTDRFEDICRFIDRLRRFRIGVSWGGTESLVLSPNRGDNHKLLKEQQIPPGTVRLSIGLEGASYLIEDLDQGLSVL